MNTRNWARAKVAGVVLLLLMSVAARAQFNASVSGSVLDPTQAVIPGATVTLTNEGLRPVRETVQVYIRDLVTSTTWADKELKSHRQVDLAPGESVQLALELPAEACTLVDADGRRVVERGDFHLLVGPSSRDTDLLSAPFTLA